mgnify:FL=1
MYDREVHKGKINKKDVSQVKISLVLVRKSWNTKNQVYLSDFYPVVFLLSGSWPMVEMVSYHRDVAGKVMATIPVIL